MSDNVINRHVVTVLPFFRGGRKETIASFPLLKGNTGKPYVSCMISLLYL